MAVAGEDLQDFGVEFLSGAFAPFRIGCLPQVGGLVAECDIVFKGVEPAVGVVFGGFLVSFQSVEEFVELPFVVAGMVEPALAEGENAVEVALESTNVQGCVVVAAGK